jgi:hypothetical protein
MIVLAVCDPRSMQPEYLIPTDRWSPEYVGEIWQTRYNSSQRWYWLSNQCHEEVLMFVTFDSQSSVEGKMLGKIFHHLAIPSCAPKLLIGDMFWSSCFPTWRS